MAKFAHRMIIFSFFACFWLFIAIAHIYGGGNKDADLSRADELISQKEYDEAILILSDYGKDNTEKFERAQQRLRKIYLIREQFNTIADELIDTLLNDPENDAKILTLTQKLRALENENSHIMKNFISRIHEIAQFNVLRNRLRNILERGREALDKGECEAALQIYAGGMSIMRDEFYTAGYGARIENEARQATERVNTIIGGFRQNSAPMGTITAELTRAINAGQLSRAPEITNRLTPVMDRFIAQKQELYSTANIFDRLLNDIRRIEPDMVDQNHLSFISIVINGRTDEAIQEGMLGAYDAYWKNSIGGVIDAIAASIETINTAGLTAFNRRDYTASSNTLSGIDNYTGLAPFFFNKHRQLADSRQPQTISMFENTILKQDTESYLKIISLREASNSLSRAAGIAMRQNFDRSSLTNFQQNRMTAAEALNREQQTSDSISALQRELELIKSALNQTDIQISSYHEFPYIKNAITAIDSVNSSLASEGRLSAQRFATIAQSYYEQMLVTSKAELERGKGLLNGQTGTNADGVTVTYYYPVEALNVFTPLLALLNPELERANAISAQLRSDPQNTNAMSEYQTVVTELTNVRDEANTLANTARSRSALAEAHRQEGERLYREAQAAYQRHDFETARTNIQRASERFDNSLEIQESTSVRASRDIQLLDLGQSIAVAENEVIIVEVRNLVNNARNSYFEGNLQQSEDNLVRARSRWRITNPDENEEIVYWLGMVRSAMSARSGRVIPVTAPLYPEMSQLLSQARRNFDEGVRLINAGQRAQGLEKFAEARMLTREVRLMFPVNQEAGLLELRMEQITDPAAFNASFEQRLRTAIAGTKRNSMESFADLQNLAEINPRYPGIRGIITQAEIDMGLRPPPPNPANIARSRELTVSASRILEGNITSQFEVALAQANEAITLDPNNLEATRVKDRLLNRMNVSDPRAIVMSSEDENDYQRALREFQAGNNLVALALVERLMQNPRNRNVTKLVELQRRIQQSAL